MHRKRGGGREEKLKIKQIEKNRVDRREKECYSPNHHKKGDMAMRAYDAAGRNGTAAAQDACAVSSCKKITAILIMDAAIAASIFALGLIIRIENKTEYSRKTTSGFAYGAA